MVCFRIVLGLVRDLILKLMDETVIEGALAEKSSLYLGNITFGYYVVRFILSFLLDSLGDRLVAYLLRFDIITALSLMLHLLN